MNDNNGSNSLVWTERTEVTGESSVVTGSVHKLYDAITAASAEFPPLPRTSTGIVGNGRKFQYSPYHKVVECIRPSLAKFGVGFLQAVHTDVEGHVSLSLIVTGHGAAIYAKMQFPRNPDIKVFGAELTYNRRYQLTAFFGLEGDPDADDYDSDDVKQRPPVVNKVVEQPSKAAVVDSGAAVAASKPATTEKPKPSAEKPVESKAEPSAAAVAKVDKRPISEKLNDAMKQLNWEFKDFNKFCEEHPEQFPDFVSVTKLNNDGKVMLYEILVSEGKVIPL